jgi:hypothetical protein
MTVPPLWPVSAAGFTIAMASGLLALKAKFAAAKFLGFLDTTPEGIANFTMMGLGRKSPERALIFLSDI